MPFCDAVSDENGASFRNGIYVRGKKKKKAKIEVSENDSIEQKSGKCN